MSNGESIIAWLRGPMLPQDPHALVVSMNNRPLQRRSVGLIIGTTIDPIITEELCDDGGVVVVYCSVQCGAVVEGRCSIQINPRMAHQRSDHIQMVVLCCPHQCCYPASVITCIHILDHAEKSVEERETAAVP